MASLRRSSETGVSMHSPSDKERLLSNNMEQLTFQRGGSVRSGLRYVIAAVIAVLFIGARFALNMAPESSSSAWDETHGTKQDEKIDASDLWDEWGDITPSEKLIWHSCPLDIDSSYRCARLTVPMDYHRPLGESSKHPKVHIAMVMVPGSAHGDDPSQDDPRSFSVSPMLVNPGGPGGSGTALAIGPFGSILRDLTGGKYDVIGFDPRGVGATTPDADCFIPDNTTETGTISRRNAGLMNRLGWLSSSHEIGLINSTDVALQKLAHRSRAIGMLCGQVSARAGNDSIFQYSNTPNVARDMLSIIHAWDEWRDQSSSSASVPDEEVGNKSTPDEIIPDMGTGEEKTAQISGTSSTKGKLVYWGFSYGTLLGATFASMFPDKVGRVILDGVVDADHYVEPSWIDSLIDADKIYDSLFDSCFQGKTACPLYREGDSGPAAVKARVEALLKALELEPRIILPNKWASISGYGAVPKLLSAGDVKAVLFLILYSPNSLFPFYAGLLNALYEDDREFLDGFLSSGGGLPALCGSTSFPVLLNDAQKTIMCSDKRYKLDETVPELQTRFERVAQYSRFADIWLGLNMDCNHWPIDAKDPPMDWDDHPIHKPEPIVTSFPLLFLSNTLDPVTPLHAALKMTRKFANASIVEQAAAGHCTISCVSACTVGHVRAYLDDGVLPKQPKFGGGPDEGDWAKCVCTQKPYGSASAEAGEVDSTLQAKYEQVHRDVLKSVPGAQLAEQNPLSKYTM